MDEKFKQFQAYDWVNCPEWRIYYDNLYPIPPGNKVIYYKKKFYKLKVDNNFDLNYDPQPQEENKPFEKIPERYTPKVGKKSIFDQLCACIEGFLIMTFLFGIVFRLNANLPALLSLLIGLLRRIGFPTFSRNYLSNCLHNQEFQMIIYFLILSFNGKNYFLFSYPISLLLLINICEYFKFYLMIFKFLIKYFERILVWKDFILDVKAKFEIAVGFYIIASLRINFSSIFSCILYLNYLRAMYYFNMMTSNAIASVNRLLLRIKNHSNCPNIIIFLIDLIQRLGCSLG